MERVTRAIALIMLAALGLAGCADRPSAREQALETATASADKVSRVGGESRFPWTLEQLGRKATAVNGVAVVKAEGTTTSTEPGVRLTVRIAASGMDPGDGFLDSGGSTEEFTFCFEVHFAPDHMRTRQEVPCPQAEPISFPPAPPPPALPTKEQLDRILRTGGADEAAIRAALDALKLDPRVRAQVEVHNSGAGIAARAVDDETRAIHCIMARSRDGEIKVWSPSSVQLQPGELTCSAGEALAGYGMTPPH